MIDSKTTYSHYVSCDLKAYGIDRVSVYRWWWHDCLRFQLRLRKIEYLYNCCRRNPLRRLQLLLLEIVNHRLATRLGFTIPKNVFGPGLCLVHYGTIVVSPKAKVGAWCRIHPGTSIGDYNGAPHLGDYVYVGPGAKLFGLIQVGNDVAIGANSVVTHDVPNGSTVAGVPAREISRVGALASGVFPSSVPSQTV